MPRIYDFSPTVNINLKGNIKVKWPFTKNSLQKN